MFLHNLTYEQKIAYLLLAKKFIMSDSRLAPEEEALIDIMSKEMGIEVNDDVVSNFEIPELCTQFDDRESQIYVLLETIILGYADNEFHPDENNFLMEMVTAFGVTNEDFEFYKSWVFKLVEHLNEAEHYFGIKRL